MTVGPTATTYPPLTAILGPARSGKTAEALARLRAVEGRCAIVVPSAAFADRLKSAMRDREARVRVDFYTPSGLFEHLCPAGAGGTPISNGVARLIVAELCRSLIPHDGFFGRVTGAPGFAESLAGLMGELKRSLVSPADLEGAAAEVAPEVEDPQFSRKVAEIGRVYAAYEALLASRELYDEDGLPVLAARCIAESPQAAGMTALALIGFHRLSAAMRDLLAALARCGVRVIVTLTHEAERPVLFATTGRTLETLRAAFAVEEVRLSAPEPAGRPADLTALERALWSGRAPDSLAAGDGSVRLYDTPNPYAEAEAVARALRREHDERGTPWRRCVTLARAAADSAAVLEAACEKLGVPLDSGARPPLSGEPGVRRLMALLDMVARDWQREDVIAFLKLGAGPRAKIAADRLRRKARRAAVRAGRAEWQRLLAGPDGAAEAQAEALARAAGWDEALRGGSRPVADWATAVGQIADELLPHDDAHGGHGIAKLVRDALADCVRASGITDRAAVSFETFRRDFAAVLSAVSVPFARPRDSVALLDANESRERDAAFTAIIGLVEKGFPRRVNEDPFFRDDEREALARAGLDLEPRRSRADEERLLFYMDATAPSERLMLSYPRASTETDALRSFYLDEVESALGRVPTTLIRLDDVAPRPEDCVDERDRLLAACARVEGDAALAGATLRAVIREHGLPMDEAELASLERVAASRSLPRAPGLSDAGHARDYAAPRPYRVTEIEAYRQCPFRHFAQYALRLHQEEDGPTAADLGDLYHRVLRRYFRRRPPGAQEAADAMRAALQQELEAALAETPLDAGGFRRRIAARSLADALAGFAGREERFRETVGLQPARFELAFGPRSPEAPEPDEADDGEGREEDPASVATPLVIDGTDRSRIELCGTIDRVDLDADGRRALLLDYKLGSAAEFKAIEAGESVQLPLYMLAAEQVFGMTAAAAAYDTPHQAGRPRFFRRQHNEERRMSPIPGEDGRQVRPLTEDQYAQVLATARQAVRAAVAGMRRADITPVPGDYCDTCPYRDLCRTTAGPVHDGEPLPAPGTA